MDTEQRKVFWNTLLSLDGKDIEADQKRLQEKILFPQYLYRYRPVNIRSLEALRTNKLYLSTANYYDDPFDTFININISDLERVYRTQTENFDDEQVFAEMKSFFSSIMSSTFDDETLKKMVHDYNSSLSNPAFYPTVLNYFRHIRNEIKKDIWSACFSENGLTKHCG